MHRQPIAIFAPLSKVPSEHLSKLAESSVCLSAFRDCLIYIRKLHPVLKNIDITIEDYSWNLIQENIKLTNN